MKKEKKKYIQMLNTAYTEKSEKNVIVILGIHLHNCSGY